MTRRQLAWAAGLIVVLLLGFLGLTISFFGTALAGSIWLLIAVRTAAGAMVAMAPVILIGTGDLTAEMVKRYKAESGASEVPPHVSMGFNQAWISSHAELQAWLHRQKPLLPKQQLLWDLDCQSCISY